MDAREHACAGHHSPCISANMKGSVPGFDREFIPFRAQMAYLTFCKSGVYTPLLQKYVDTLLKIARSAVRRGAAPLFISRRGPQAQGTLVAKSLAGRTRARSARFSALKRALQAGAGDLYQFAKRII